MSYFFKINASEWFFFIIYSVILLVVKSDALFMFGNTIVSDGFNEVDSLINDNLMLCVWIIFVFEFEIILWKCLNGEIGSTDSTLLAKDVSGFSNTTSNNVVKVWFVSFHFMKNSKKIL